MSDRIFCHTPVRWRVQAKATSSCPSRPSNSPVSPRLGVTRDRNVSKSPSTLRASPAAATASSTCSAYLGIRQKNGAPGHRGSLPPPLRRRRHEGRDHAPPSRSPAPPQGRRGPCPPPGPRHRGRTGGHRRRPRHRRCALEPPDRAGPPVLAQPTTRLRPMAEVSSDQLITCVLHSCCRRSENQPAICRLPILTWLHLVRGRAGRRF